MSQRYAQTNMRIESDELRALLDGPPLLERVATGFRFVEGPVWVSDGDYLLFSDIPANTIYRWDEQHGTTIFRQPSDFTNGHTLDKQGRLLSCEHGTRRVSRTEADGTIVVLASHYAGKRLNSPNDIVVKSDGSIYFTDPTYGQKLDEGNCGPQELRWQGVYRISADGADLTLLTAAFRAPNGLAFSPDEARLYVDDSEDMFIGVYDVLPDGRLGDRRIIADGMGSHAARRGVPDGMKVDTAGRLWATGPEGVWVFDADDRKIGVLPVPEIAANLNWGAADRRTLYITASTSVYRVRLKTPGV